MISSTILERKEVDDLKIGYCNKTYARYRKHA